MRFLALPGVRKADALRALTVAFCAFFHVVTAVLFMVLKYGRLDSGFEVAHTNIPLKTRRETRIHKISVGQLVLVAPPSTLFGDDVRIRRLKQDRRVEVLGVALVTSFELEHPVAAVTMPEKLTTRGHKKNKCRCKQTPVAFDASQKP